MRNLVEQARTGDEAAFTALATASIDRLYVIAHRILRDSDLAGDAVQTTLLRAWRDLHQLARRRPVRRVALPAAGSRLLRAGARRAVVPRKRSATPD